MTPTPADRRDAAAPTVAGWIQAVAAGIDLLPRLQELRRDVLGDEASGVWIHLCPSAEWARQIDRLATLLAQAADRRELLQRHPLLGVPFAVKDNIDIAGQPTTAACPMFAHRADDHATVVRRLLDAGAVWLGKTNLDQFATGLVGTRSPYGRPAAVARGNDGIERISGGSSSGSAVAVARGRVAFALGTDTAGSGRIPAGFNGLVGCKPTPGRVSTAGVLPACRTLDCVSVFARTVDDAASVLAVIEGTDAADDYSAFVPGRASLVQQPGQVLRVGVPAQPTLDGAIGYRAAWQTVLGRLAEQGHRVLPVDFAPLHEVAALLYEGPWVAERHAVVQELLQRNGQALDPAVRQVVARAEGLSATETFVAQYRLRALQRRLAGLWADVDLLLVPTAPTHPSFAQVDADPLGVNAGLGLYTNFVNLLGWCALALPAGNTSLGLPFGVTAIGRGGDDVALMGFGRSWEGGSGAGTGRQPAVQPELLLAVVGAHLLGLPLNGQLIERGARFVRATTTAATYRLHALPGTVPPKPGLVRCQDGPGAGAAIEVEVWAMPLDQVGSFLALIPAPLGLGSIELADGRQVHGFLCEAHAAALAPDISHFGGWRAYLASLAAPAAGSASAHDQGGPRDGSS